MGAAGEAAAVDHLRDQGFRILAVDWRAALGQIDIVAEDAGTLVIVEVKARRGTGFGRPEEAVDFRKQRKLRQLTEAFRLATGRGDQPCRIDVIGLILSNSLDVVDCVHIRDAVAG